MDVAERSARPPYRLVLDGWTYCIDPHPRAAEGVERVIVVRADHPRGAVDPSERTMTSVLADILRATYRDDIAPEGRESVLCYVREAVELHRQQRRGAVSADPKAALAEALESVLGLIDTEEAAANAVEAVCQALGWRPGTDHPRGAVSGALDEPQAGTCGRLLVGQGTDTWDPECVLPSGHAGICASREEDADA